MITTRLLRLGDTAAEQSQWGALTPEERIEAVWELTLQCLAWHESAPVEPQLQRTVVRVQRRGR